MIMPTTNEPGWEQALTTSVVALRRLAGYSLDPALDRRILLLGERKADLTPAEHDELLAWVAFTQQRSIEKLEAKVALQRLYNVCPELGSPA